MAALVYVVSSFYLYPIDFDMGLGQWVHGIYATEEEAQQRAAEVNMGRKIERDFEIARVEARPLGAWSKEDNLIWRKNNKKKQGPEGCEICEGDARAILEFHPNADGLYCFPAT